MSSTVKLFFTCLLSFLYESCVTPLLPFSPVLSITPLLGSSLYVVPVILVVNVLHLSVFQTTVSPAGGSPGSGSSASDGSSFAVYVSEL